MGPCFPGAATANNPTINMDRNLCGTAPNPARFATLVNRRNVLRMRDSLVADSCLPSCFYKSMEGGREDEASQSQTPRTATTGKVGRTAGTLSSRLQWRLRVRQIWTTTIFQCPAFGGLRSGGWKLTDSPPDPGAQGATPKQPTSSDFPSITYCTK